MRFHEAETIYPLHMIQIFMRLVGQDNEINIRVFSRRAASIRANQGQNNSGIITL
jgi:hypothetical protein